MLRYLLGNHEAWEREFSAGNLALKSSVCIFNWDMPPSVLTPNVSLQHLYQLPVKKVAFTTFQLL